MVFSLLRSYSLDHSLTMVFSLLPLHAFVYTHIRIIDGVPFTNGVCSQILTDGHEQWHHSFRMHLYELHHI